MTDEDIFGKNSDIMEYHCQNNPCLKETIFAYSEKMAEGFFGKYESPQDRIYKLQLLQCEWLRISFELFKRNQWFSSGIVFLCQNLNNPLPITFVYCRIRDFLMV